MRISPKPIALEPVQTQKQVGGAARRQPITLKPRAVQMLRDARNHLRRGEASEAIRLAEALLRLVPGDGEAHLILAYAEYSMGDDDMAWCDIQAAMCDTTLNEPSKSWQVLGAMGLMDSIVRTISKSESARQERYRNLCERRRSA